MKIDVVIAVSWCRYCREGASGTARGMRSRPLIADILPIRVLMGPVLSMIAVDLPYAQRHTRTSVRPPKFEISIA